MLEVHRCGVAVGTGRGRKRMVLRPWDSECHYCRDLLFTELLVQVLFRQAASFRYSSLVNGEVLEEHGGLARQYLI
ncbi:hypothetical protein E2C01_032649 [Portunus trituberculatus]|uniref:Uncharacterized protein n=1 Tax=Portunus trituberculatus TaxID=210409 RepID=A0A5B7F1J4_PORTR|nr:hypothetical protein [Portunus trituberculatus]